MLRKSLMLAVLAGFVGHSGPVLAQGLPPEDGGGFEIDTAAPEEEAGFFENLSQYVGAAAGVNSGSSDAVEKTMQGISFTFDFPRYAGIKTALAVDVGDFENVYKLELDEGRRQSVARCRELGVDVGAMTENERNEYENNNCEDALNEAGDGYLADSVSQTVSDSFTDVVEGFVQWEPTSFATLRAGRQPIVIGQFETFSPLMFTVPLKATGTKTRTTKSDMSFAQDGFQVSLFPFPQLEVSATLIPAMRIDPSTKKKNEEQGLTVGDATNFNPDGRGQNEKLQDEADHDMTVLRLMYFGDRFTFGVTSIEGAETNEEPVRDAKLVRVNCDAYSPAYYTPCFSTNFPVPDAYSGNPSNLSDPWNSFTETQRQAEAGTGLFNTYYLGEDKGLFYPEASTTAIELSYRISNKWTFVFETTTVETQRMFDILPNGGEAGTKPVEYFDGGRQVDILAIYDEIWNAGYRLPYVNVETTMSSVGMVFKGDRWLANLQIAQRTQEGASAEEEAYRKKLDPVEYEDEDGEDTLPILNVVRLLGAEKQGYAGFGFGAFGQSFGFGLSGGWRYFEKLEIGGFAGFPLDVVGSDEIERQGYDSPESDNYMSIGVNYLF